MNNDSKYISAKQLVKKRGWSRMIIRELLKTPDKIEPNTINHAGPIKLYDIDRVKNIEKSDRFSIYKKYIERRRKSVQKGKEKRKIELLNFLNNINIVIPKMDLDVLKNMAENNYLSQRSYMDSMYGLTGDIDESHDDFVNRITVEYLRDSFSTYYRILKERFDKMDRTQAYIELNKRIFSEILRNYPELEFESRKQLD